MTQTTKTLHDYPTQKAKEAYATQLATSSGFTYQMIAGTLAKQGLAATGTDGFPPRLAAEDQAEYGNVE